MDSMTTTTHFAYDATKPHDYAAHVEHMLGFDTLSPSQSQYGGYAFLSAKSIVARSTITGLRPVIEQAIEQTKAANPGVTGEALEAKIAQTLTGYNDWANLTAKTQNEIMILTGVNFDAMTDAERETTINHLIHSPLPFGEITQVLTPDTKIDMGYTHTLDKAKTQVENLGNGQWKIFMISNNNDGSHTGHVLGSFVVNLGLTATADIAKTAGNAMVTNTNDNTKLYLDQAARDILYGTVAQQEFEHPTTTTMEAGHTFLEHASHLYGDAVVSTQKEYSGYTFLNDKYVVARSTITGLQPVIEQAIKATKAANPGLTGDALESKIAQTLTGYNDWADLTVETQAELMILTGINFGAMTEEAREKTLNHLLHSPVSFGVIEKALTKDVKIDMGYTHTLDKDKTLVEVVGDGLFKITMISNNNNGSHTGHTLGQFVLSLKDGTALLPGASQFATSATASNQYSAGYANYMKGESDTNSWWASATDVGLVTMNLGFETAAKASSITLKSYPGYPTTGVSKIELQDDKGVWHTVWTGNSDTMYANGADGRPTTVITFPETSFVTKNARLTVDTAGSDWETIDSVALSSPGIEANYDLTKIKQIANDMVANTNDNTKLYLDQAARDILFGNISENKFDMTHAYTPSHDHTGHAPTKDYVTEGANLITNGTFEANKLASYYQALSNGQVSGWTNTNGGAIELQWQNFDKKDDNVLELDSTAGKDAIAQTITTVAGKQYELAFNAALRPDLAGGATSSTFEVLWNGKVIAQINPAYKTFVNYSYKVTGTGGNDVLTFREAGTTNDSLGAVIDEVSLLAIKDPMNTIEAAGGYTGGTDAAELIRGGEGYDAIYGGKGDDRIEGGKISYNQVNYDGAKSEYTFARNADGTVSVKHPTWGTDTLKDVQGLYFAAENKYYALIDLVADAANANHTFTADATKGGLLDGTNGNDTFMGGAGNDIFYGGKGNDSYDGGEGWNEVYFAGSASEYTFKQNADGTVTVTHATYGTDTLKNIQGVMFFGEGKYATVEEMVAASGGGSGSGVINGTDGNDTLNGTNGNDVFYGAKGDDTYDGGEGNDVVNLDGTKADYHFVLNADDSVKITSTTYGTKILKNVESLHFLGDNSDYDPVSLSHTHVTGTDGDDRMTGTRVDDNLKGGLGNDVFYGGLGNDVLDGEGGDYNQVDFDGAPTDYTFTKNADGSVTVKSDVYGTDTLKNIQGVWFYGENKWYALEDLAKDANAINSIKGTDAAETLTGTAGNDALDGYGGNDVLNGLDGDDLFYGGLGDDTINGGAGTNDIADYDGKAADYMVMKNADGTYTVSNATYGTDTLKDVEGLFFFGDNTYAAIDTLAHSH